MLRVEAAGDTTIKSLVSDRDVIIPFGSRLNIADGNYTTVGAGSDFNGFWAQGTTAGSDAATGGLTSSSGTLTITNGQPTGNLTLTDNQIRVFIEDPSVGTPLALVKNNNNSLVLDRANTYTGGTTINGGRINADNLAAFGTGTVTVNDGGQAFLTQGGTYANNFVINGPGVTEGAGDLGAIRFSGATVSGDIDVASSARITAFGSTGTHTGALTGSADLQVNTPGGTGTLNLNGDTSSYTGTMTLNSGTLNVGELGGGLTLAGGTVNLSGSVPGATTIAQGTTVNLNDGAQIGTPVFPTGSNRTLNVNTGSTIAGDVITDFDEDSVTLNLAGTVTGDVFIDDLSSLGLLGGTIGGNLTTGFDNSSSIPWNFIAPVAVTEDLKINGEQVVTLAANPTPGSPATILTYNGDFIGDIDDFILANPANYRSVSFQDTGSAITVSTGGDTRTWVGDDATNPTFWDTVTPNWAEDDNLFFNGDAVVFDDTAESFTVAMQGLLSPYSVTFNNDEDYNVTGAGGHGFTGSTGITKNGTGSVTLAGFAHNYTGPVVINAGTLVAGSFETLGLTSGLTVNDGGRFDIAGRNLGNGTRAYTVTIEGDGGDGTGAIINSGAGVASNAGFGGLTLSGNATVGGTGRFDIGLAAGFGTTPRFINGGGFTLTKTGTNQIVARGPATDITYVVNEGTLTFEDFDSASGTETITVNGGTVNTWGPRTLNNDVSLAAGTTFGNQGGGAANWTGTITTSDTATVQTSGNLTLSGALVGDATITRTGGFTLVLENTATAFSGKWVSTTGGVLRISDSQALGTGSGADLLTLGGGVTLQGGTSTAQGSATITSATQGITQTGNVTYSAGAGNTITINGEVAGTGNIVANTSGTVQFNNTINLPTGGLYTNSDAVVTITGPGGVLGNSESVGGIRMSRSTLNLAHTGDLDVWDIQTGEGGTQEAILNQTSGNVNSTVDVRIGHWGGATSVYNISGGSLNLPDTVTAPTNEFQANLFIGIDGSGVLNISGSGVVNTSSLVINGRDAGTDTMDILNLTGGELNIGRWGIRSGGAGNPHEINLGGGKLGAWAADWSSDRTFTLTGTNGDVTIDTLDAVDETTPRNITLSGPVEGPGGFIKTGPGALVLTGSKTYEGEAVIEEGLLVANGTLPGTLTIEEGASLLAGTTAVGTSVQTLTIGDGFDTPVINGQVIVDLNALDEDVGGTVNDLIEIPGDVEFGPNSTILPRFYGGAVQSGNVYTVMQVDGDRTGLPVVDPAIADNVRFDFTVSTGAPPFEGDIFLEISGEAGDLVWTGAQNFLWNTNIDQNWTIDGTPTEFKISDSVTFDDSGDSSSPVELIGELFVGDTFVNATADYTFAGTGFISGTGNLVKDGSGTLTILTNNANTGTVAINGGGIVVGDGGTTGQLGGQGEIPLAEGTFLTFNRSDNIGSSRAITGEGTLIQNGPGTYQFSAPGSEVLPENIVVNGGVLHISTGGFGTARLPVGSLLTINEGGTVLLSGAPHALGSAGGPLGQVDILGGTLTVNNEQYIHDATLDGALINGTNEIRATFSTEGVWSVTGDTPSEIAARVAYFGTAIYDVEDVTGDADADLILSGTQAAAGGLVKRGDGTILVTGDYGHSGPITLEGGVLAIEKTGSLTVPNTLLGDGGAIRNDSEGTLTLSADSPDFQATIDSAEKDVTILGDFGGDGSVIEMTGSTVNLGAPVSEPAPEIAINFVDTSGEGDQVTDTTTAKGPTGALVWNNTTTRDAGTLANGSINDLVDSAGDPTGISASWTSANTWRGASDTNLQNGKITRGYLDDGAGGNTVTITGLPSGSPYTVYGIIGSDQGSPFTLRDFAVNGTTVFGQSVQAYSTWPPPGDAWVEITTTETGNYWKVEGVTGSTLTIVGNQSASGRGPLAGLVIVGEALGEPQLRTMFAGLALNGGLDTTVRVDGVNDYNLNGAITGGTENILKTGARALYLNGDSTFTGTTTVAEGTLGGNGSLAGPLVMELGTTLNPGASVGTLTAGDTTLETGSSFVMEVDSSSNAGSSLVVNGDATIQSGVTLDVVDIAETPGTLANGLVFSIIEASGTVTGTFDGLPDGSIITINGVDLTLNYTASAVTLSTPPSLGTPFDDWLAGFGIDGEPNTGLFDSFDGSGVTNIMQFALGGDPTDPANNGVKALFTRNTEGNEELIITIAVRQGASFAGSPSMTATIDDITYTVMGSLDLVDWDQIVEEVTPVQNDAGALEAPAGYQLKSFRLDGSENFPDKGFLRVEVDEEEEPGI